MSPNVWLPTIIMVAAEIILAVVGAIYLHGKFAGSTTGTVQDHDGDLKRHEDRLEKLDRASALLEEGLRRHEKDCDRRYGELSTTFAKIDRGLDLLTAKIDKIATGRAGKLYEVRSPRPLPKGDS
ncbi:MAG: hypothetical protein ACRED8_09425 [Caulobacteraceae bacterium]